MVHCTTSMHPPILSAKLSRGFPHLRFAFPINTVPAEHDISRFNIARGRYLRSGNSPLPESDRNGRYYDAYELPVARSDAERRALLEAADVNRVMLEILLHERFPLPDTTEIHCFSDWDNAQVTRVLESIRHNIAVAQHAPVNVYPEHEIFRFQVAEFIENALADPEWKGNGLDFDRLR